MSTTVKSQRITHTVTATFDPRPFVSGDASVDNVAHQLVINWQWDNDVWSSRLEKVTFYRIKRDGELFANPQTATIWAGEASQFADVIEANRPQYTPVLVGDPS